MDLQPVVDELRSGSTRASDVISLLKSSIYYASSVTFPEMAVATEVVRRDSRQYNFPSWDNAPGQVRVDFIHNIATKASGDVRRSEIYLLLDQWRARVRAGRGSMSVEESYALDANFRPPEWQFNVTVRMAAGYPLMSPSGEPLFIPGIGDEGAMPSDSEPKLDPDQIEDKDGPSLEMSSAYELRNLWLASMTLADVNYESSGVHKINAIFYADDVVQL